MDQQRFKCSICSKAYQHFKNLRVHVKQTHPNELDTIAPLPSKKYSCSFCGKQYNTKTFLSSHERKVHAVVCIIGNRLYNCPLCDYSALFKNKLMEHFLQVHNIVLETEQHIFHSSNDFESWKNIVEQETGSKFVQKSGCLSKRITQIVYYKCHRSGTFTSKSIGLRRLKSKGSKKIGGLCPAMMAVGIKNNVIRVKFTKTHVGHKSDLDHLPLNSSERIIIAKKIASDVPFDSILDEVRQFVTIKEEFTKLDTITKLDLHNIKRQFDLDRDSYEEQPSKCSSLYTDAWVHDMENRDSCVLLYKPIGTAITELPKLKLEDFILVLMNDTQKKMLQLHGLNVICIDRTHSSKPYSFEVITILVLDELNQGFPCCFLISNRCDEDILTIFFELVKDNFGILSPNIFMSDIEESFYKVFSTVMTLPDRRLLCCWHIDNAWRKNLKKISSKEKQIEAYQMLRKLLHETDVETFNSLISETINNMLLDPDMMEFGSYFIKTFTENVELWSSCYTQEFNVSVNMHLETLHKVIRNICFREKNITKLDVVLNMLMDFIQDRLNDGLVLDYKEKIANKILVIAERHHLSRQMQDTIITENLNGWDIRSKNYPETYFIQENSNKCNCDIRCVECCICIHKFCCSCRDSSLKQNICTHIHLLSMLQSDNFIPNDLPDAAEIFEDVNIVSATKSSNCVMELSNSTNDLVLLIPATQEVQLGETKNVLPPSGNQIFVLVPEDATAVCVGECNQNSSQQDKAVSQMSFKENLLVVDAQPSIELSEIGVEQIGSGESSLSFNIQNLNSECIEILKTISTRNGLLIAKNHLSSLKAAIENSPNSPNKE